MSDKKYTTIKHDKAAGRVEFQGGKAIWHWAEDSNDSTSVLIKSLENPELELEVTQRTPIMGSKAKGAAAGAGQRADADREADKRADERRDDDSDWEVPRGGGGFDPYNRS